MKFLLDTNVISEIRKGERADTNVTRWVVRTPVQEIGTSVIVLAEIRRGIELKRRRDQEQAKSLDRWFAQMRARLGDRVLPIDEPIADAWALLGIPDPLPLIDGLLAATAKVHGLTLVTRNTADLLRTGVTLLDPFSPSSPRPHVSEEGGCYSADPLCGSRWLTACRTRRGAATRCPPHCDP